MIIQGIAAGSVPPEPLAPTHGRDRLLWDQFVTNSYWHRHGLPPRAAPDDGPLAARIRTLRQSRTPPAGLPWLTLRDAIANLGPPDGQRDHVFQLGARTYPGHTGSPLDWPAKALKAGDHGVPGGENMIRFVDGSVRYLTVREAARLVGLSDDYRFPRSWTETMRQLGNAVPVPLAEAAARALKRRIEGGKRHDEAAE